MDWTTPQSHNEISTNQTTLSAPSLLSSTATSSAGSRLRDQPVFTPAPTASPYQQYESFRVSVPTNDQVAGRPQYAVPQYVAPQNYGTYNTYQNQGALGTASGLPTQLTANQWNIASALNRPEPSCNPRQTPINSIRLMPLKPVIAKSIHHPTVPRVCGSKCRGSIRQKIGDKKAMTLSCLLSFVSYCLINK